MSNRKLMTMHRIREMHAAGEKISMLTCYDAVFARVLDDAGVDVLLVGDSLGMVLQGHPTTLPVSMENMVYHTASVARGNRTAWLIADGVTPSSAAALRKLRCRATLRNASTPSSALCLIVKFRFITCRHYSE